MSKPLTVLYVIDSDQSGPFFGGAELHVVDSVAHIDRTRFLPLCASNNQELLKYIGENVPVVTPTYFFVRRSKLIRDLCCTYDLFLLFKKVRPNIVHLHKLRASVWGRIAACLAGVPVIITTVHGAPSFWQFNWFRTMLNSYLNTFTANYFSSLTIVSSQIEKTALLQEGVREEKIAIVKLGIFDNAALLEIPRAKSELRSILAVGRLTWEKDFATLLRAFAGVVKTIPNMVLYIAGNGPELNSLREIRDSLGIKDRVIFLGAIPSDEMSNLYAKVDLVVVSSLWESFSYVAVEAMFAGLPLVVTNTGALPEIVNLRGAIVVDPCDPPSMTQAIVRFAGDTQLRYGAGKQNREHAQACYTGIQMIRALETLYTKYSNGS